MDDEEKHQQANMNEYSSKKQLSKEAVLSKESKGHPHSHDLGVKRALLRIYIAKLLCRMIFAKADHRLEQIIDWKTLEYAKGDTIEKKETRSDFALNVNFKNPKHKAQILLFLEHFSHPDSQAMFRLLSQHARFYSQQENKDRMVFSVVISQGVSGKKWDLPLTFQEDLQTKGILPDEYLDILGTYLVNFKTFFFDLQKVVISTLNPILRPIFYVFKHIKKAHPSNSREVRHRFLKDVYRLIADVAEEMKTSPDVQEIFEDLKETKEFANLSRDDIIKGIIIDELEDIALYLMQYNPEMREDVLQKAYKEVFIERGGQNYMEELEFTREGAKLKGIEIGLQKGRQEGLKNVILNMLKRKMDLSTIMGCTGASKKQVLELQKQAGL